MELRRLERKLVAEPTIEHLVEFLSGVFRTGIAANQYPGLIRLLTEIGPFTRETWPWYLSYSKEYRAYLHQELLNLIVRIRPITMLSAFTTNPLQLLGGLQALRMALIVPPDGELGQHPQLWTLDEFPEFIGLDTFTMSRNFENTPAMIVATAVWNSDPTTRKATRYFVDLETEPGASVSGKEIWSNQHGRWITEERRWASTTFLPYKDFCEEHKKNVDQCAPCEICKDKAGHPCQCLFCHDCGRYFNTWKNELIPANIRCNCEYPNLGIE